MDYDIAIVGAGLAGACTAALLAREKGLSAARVVLIDAEASESIGTIALDAPPELRVVAVSRASERILSAAGAWQRLPRGRLCPYERMRVWEEGSRANGPGSLCFDAADIGEPNLGYIIENSLLQGACLASFRDSGGQVLPGRLQALTIEPAAARLTLHDGRSLTVRLVIGADGAQSAVRALLGIRVQRRAFGQIGIVANLRTERSHQDTAWQRFLHTGPLALLPLFDASSSLVWTIDETRARALLDCSDVQFAAQVQSAADEVLGAMTLVGARHGFPLQSLVAADLIAPRCALIGDAAHVIHPLAGQGANLGLLDADALCSAVSAAMQMREDPGALRALRKYEQQRRTHNLLMDTATRAIRHGFAQSGLSRWLMQRGLDRVEHSGALKRFFAREALGLGIFAPRLSALGSDRASLRR